MGQLHHRDVNINVPFHVCRSPDLQETRFTYLVLHRLFITDGKKDIYSNTSTIIR